MPQPLLPAIFQLQDSLAAGVPSDSVHAVVARIAREAAFRRSARTSILGRLWHWLSDLLDRLFEAFAGLPNSRLLAIVGVVLVALLVVARILYASRLGVDELELTRRRTGGRAEDPLAEAQRLAEAGDYTEAAHHLYRALLETLARRDGVRLHASKTTGDYARELRRRGSGAHAAFGQFARRYDRVLYGHDPVDADAWRVLWRDAGAILARERAA